MPRGVPKQRDFYSENTKRLMEHMADLQARINAERQKDRARMLLLKFAKVHGLTPKDLRNAATALGSRNVADQPVMSKNFTGHDKGNLKFGAKTMKPAKGKTGKAIRKARLKLGLTAEAMAARIGVGASSVVSWEHGREVKHHHHAKLIEAGVPKSALPNGAAA